jgi:pilus assembly protein Flp/PilA
MSNLWRGFWKDESGQGLVEYVLIIALVAIGLIAIMVFFRNAIGTVFARASNNLNNAPTASFPVPAS